ncbi:MAG: class I SAM-dependent methyltransferase [Planctomycetota bacterium]|nr:MAG: class I SAM-dependent methyltransferase [Planctomycetota bacterium]
MGVGPAWRSKVRAADQDIVDEARRVGEQLLASLEEGRRLTRDWQDDRLARAWVDAAMSDCLRALADLGVWGRENEVASDALWQVAGDQLCRGRLQLRAREKPLGYAGDYQMLAWICERAVCEDSLGRFFDLYFLDQAAPQCVRNRTRLIAAELACHGLRCPRRPYRILSVGVGPGLDIAKAVATLPPARRKDVEIALVDLDEAGLAYAQQQLRRLIADEQITCLRDNVFRLPQRSDVLPWPDDTDFVVCSGLFDYLDDEAATNMLATFRDQLREGGRLLVGNFAPHCPTRAYMEWIGKWYLRYRTVADLERLAESACLPARWRVGADATGVNLLLEFSA